MFAEIRNSGSCVHTAAKMAHVDASYAATASPAAVTPQICINAVSVHPDACEGHVPPGIYWYQGQIWNGTYQYMDTNTGCSMYYSTYQGPYVAVTSDDG